MRPLGTGFIFAVCAVATLLLSCSPSGDVAKTPLMQSAAKTQGVTLYVSSTTKASVYLFDYPHGKPLFTIIGFYGPSGLCSDSNGNVWVTDTDPYTNEGFLEEYAPRRKHSTATLTDPGNSPRGCAVDPTTGNLAVADVQDNIAIYADAQGTPTYYSTAGVVEKPSAIAYDAAGNAYFSGASRQLGLLSAGASKVALFKLKPKPPKHGPVRWDGQYLTVPIRAGSQTDLWRYQPSGSSAKRIGIVELGCCLGDYAIHDAIVAATAPVFNAAFVSKYPAGGPPFLNLNAVDPTGVAISASPADR